MTHGKTYNKSPRRINHKATKSKTNTGIKPEFMKMVKHIFDNSTLAPSQYRAILTLLYKKGERENIANWRPISSLNTDYKIITKVLAERLKIFLPKLIHPDQKGFITGRNIADANRLLQDAVEYSEQRGKNSSIIFLDYNKPSDRVEWQWVLKCLEKFNFGPNFIQCINMLLKEAKTCILTNGFRSMYFPITRSMHQRCPIGPLIYILQAEPLACAIRKNKNIIGLPLPRISSVSMRRDEVKLNAFVDDTQLFNLTEESITECFKTISKYEKASGASIHKHKTIGLYIGPWKEKNTGIQ